MSQRTRACVDCEADISGRHRNSIRCEACAAAEKKRIQRDRVRPHRSTRPRLPRVRPRRSCVACGREFQPKQDAQETCSVACWQWREARPGIPRLLGRPCVVCGDPVTDTRAGVKYCSRRCAVAADKRRRRPIAAEYQRATICVHCGADLSARKAGTLYCSDECWSRETYAPGSYTYRSSRRCERCGEPLGHDERVNRRHCSDRCTVLANQVVRRARRRRLPAERFPVWEIFERDNWVCHICGTAVDETLHDRHPMSASLDHLIPFSHPASPGHVRSNVALAHLRCNFSKNGRVREADWHLHRQLKRAA